MSAAGTTGQVLTSGGTGAPTWASSLAMSGDISVDNAGVVTVTALQSRPVSNSAPSTNQVLQYNGSSWSPANNVATTNANLTGVITSVGNATSIASQTGSGTKFVVDNSPTLITPNIGAATATSLNSSGTVTASSFVKSAGLSSQFLKADGSVDANTYLTSGSGVSSITGTANQISASGSTGAVTLSLPAILTGLTSVTATNFLGNATTSTTATNLAGGSIGAIPYQSGSGTTALLSAGTSGQVLTSSGAGAPTWSSGIALTGDVTIDNSGVSTIANNAVTYGKMQALSATSKLLGSSSTTTPVQEISLGSGLSLSGTTLSASGTGGTVTSVAALTLGTTGTDLASSVANGSSTPVITLNVPTASATNRGALSSTDWSTFNGKQNVLTNSAGLAGALSDETGTGLAVFGTAPTFASTITVGTTGVTTGAINLKGTTSGTATLTVPAVAGTPTLTLPATTGTLALLSDITSGTATNFTGNLAGDVSGTQGATLIGTGAVTSSKILDGTIVDADVNAAAAIAGTKINPDFGNQTLTIGTPTGSTAGTIVLHDATTGTSNTTTLQSNSNVGTSFTLTLPNSAGTNNQVLKTDGSGNLSWSTPTVGTVTSVSGTTNRISVTGTSTPVVDIDANYVGQTSITTLGTVAAGTWHGTLLDPTYGGTGVNNGAKTITLGGNINTAGTLTTVGGATTLNSAAGTNVTLPATGTLATLSGTETLANKTVNTVASSAAAAGLNLPPGTAPSSPANGDLWTTASGIYARIGGVTSQLSSTTGTVTSVSTAAANNGVTATWSMATPTPALTIGLGAITPTSVVASGSVTGTQLVSTVSTGTAPLTVTSTTPVPNLSILGNAATSTNLSGGSAGTLPYQSAANTTAMLAAGTSGQLLVSGGAGSPAWSTPNATGTLPIVVASGGTTAPVISINPATQFSAGSLSAADKIKLDNFPNLAVQALSGTTPSWNGLNGINATITLTGNTTISIGNLQAGASGNLTVTNAATAYTLTFSGYSNRINPGIYSGVASSVTTSGSSKVDVFSWYYDGTSLFWNGTLSYQ